MINTLGDTFLSQGIGSGIIWVVALELFMLLLLSVWQKGPLSGPGLSRGTEPVDEEREASYEVDVPQHPEQMAFIEIEVEAGE